MNQYTKNSVVYSESQVRNLHLGTLFTEDPTEGFLSLGYEVYIPPPPPPPTPEQIRQQAKWERDQAVAAITVTTAAGNTFDGDETSQTRMARAIIALNATATPSVNWVLADNSVIEATPAELSEALALAGAAQAAIWVIP